MNKFKTFGIALMSTMLLAACSGTSDSESTSSSVSSESSAVSSESSAAAETSSEATTFANLTTDVEAKTVTVEGTVNGKYFDEETRHLSIANSGKNVGLAIFNTDANQNDFYDALVQIGAEPGNNMNTLNAQTTTVEGTKLNIALDWEGNGDPIDVNDAVIDRNGKEIDMRFGGNEKSAADVNTGCLLCLDSCPVGVVSNATYTYGAVEKRDEAGFKGNPDVLPADGTPIQIIVSIAE